MKKIFFAAFIMLLTMGAVSAQNNFRGIAKYSLTSSGSVDVSIPADQATAEIKIFDNRLLFGQTMQNGLKVVQAADFSPILQYLSMSGISLESYEGDGKFLIRGEFTKEQLDSGYIVDMEPGHYYYEMVDETQQMFGFTAKKLIMHRYNEEGVDNPAICWYTTEVGPEYCLVLGAIKGFPLVHTQELGEGRAITFTCVELNKGKVKEVDMLPPSGYKDASEEEFEDFQRQLQDAAELLDE